MCPLCVCTSARNETDNIPFDAGKCNSDLANRDGTRSLDTLRLCDTTQRVNGLGIVFFFFSPAFDHNFATKDI